MALNLCRATLLLFIRSVTWELIPYWYFEPARVKPNYATGYDLDQLDSIYGSMYQPVPLTSWVSLPIYIRFHTELAVFFPVSGHKHCANSERDGQAELAWVASEMVYQLERCHHPLTNQAQRTATSLIKTNALPLCPITNHSNQNLQIRLESIQGVGAGKGHPKYGAEET